MQIATTGCMINHSFLGVAWPPLGVAQPLLACPLQEEPGGYLHGRTSAYGCDLFALPLPFLAGISSALLCQEVERILILMLE